MMVLQRAIACHAALPAAVAGDSSAVDEWRAMLAGFYVPMIGDVVLPFDGANPARLIPTPL